MRKRPQVRILPGAPQEDPAPAGFSASAALSPRGAFALESPSCLSDLRAGHPQPARCGDQRDAAIRGAVGHPLRRRRAVRQRQLTVRPTARRPLGTRRRRTHARTAASVTARRLGLSAALRAAASRGSVTWMGSRKRRQDGSGRAATRSSDRRRRSCATRCTGRAAVNAVTNSAKRRGSSRCGKWCPTGHTMSSACGSRRGATSSRRDPARSRAASGRADRVRAPTSRRAPEVLVPVGVDHLLRVTEHELGGHVVAGDQQRAGSLRDAVQVHARTEHLPYRGKPVPAQPRGQLVHEIQERLQPPRGSRR